VSTQGQDIVLTIWSQVIFQNGLLTDEQWTEVVNKYNSQGGRIPFQTVLMTTGYVPPKKIPLMRVLVETRVWKNLLIQNKLLSQDLWKDAFTQFNKAGGRIPIREILKRQGVLDEASIDKVHNRVQSLFGEAPAPPAPKRAAPQTPPQQDDPQKMFSVEDGPSLGGGATQAPPAPAAPSAPAQARPAASSVDQVDVPPQPDSEQRIDDDAWNFLYTAVQMGASDLHLTSGSRPFMRLHGELEFFDAPPITPEQGERMVLSFLSEPQREVFLEHRDLDLSWSHPMLSRCRANCLMQFRGPSIILRIIPSQIPTLADLGLPTDLENLTEWTQGLVLVTGPAGCGKSTTAAALVDCVNRNRKDHVITVEDPIEYLHPSKSCNITQRQVHPHTESFSTALKAALREDPDVIMIGEMRDLETISLAMTAAETGHLVIGTLHTKSAARTIDRIVDVFPADQQAQVRTMLAGSLRGIITQQLVRKIDGSGRLAALEILYVNTAVGNLIRDSKTFQLASVMQTGRKHGQRLMDESLDELVKAGQISKEEAIKVAENPKRFQ